MESVRTTVGEALRTRHYERTNKDQGFPQMQILKYMGNKRRLLKWLIPHLRTRLNYGETLLDLFAGTASVSYALKLHARVIANDVQVYSSVISNALLRFNGDVSIREFHSKLGSYYKNNMTVLMRRYKKALREESKLINEMNTNGYARFSRQLPRYLDFCTKDSYMISKYADEGYIHLKRKGRSFPFTLFTTYYPGTFFSLFQCIEIDSLRYAIDSEQDETKRAVYLGCLMYAMSNTVNSSGHFAEFLGYEAESTTKSPLKKHSTSLTMLFLQKVLEFEKKFVRSSWENLVYCQDYKSLITQLAREDLLKNIKLIYIDPPYTTAQYSRFYHIPETLVKYDYPELTVRLPGKRVKGGYRSDRQQSPFSQLSNALTAFEEMFKTIANYTDATIAVSYSDNSIIRPVDQLTDLASKYYKTVEKKNGYSHSAQGSRFKENGSGHRKVNEHLLICERKRNI